MTKEAIDVFRSKLEECPYISEQLDSVLERLYAKCYPSAGYEEDGSMSDYQYGDALFHVVLSITQDENILLEDRSGPDREEDLPDQALPIDLESLLPVISECMSDQEEDEDLSALMNARIRRGRQIRR